MGSEAHFLGLRQEVPAAEQHDPFWNEVSDLRTTNSEYLVPWFGDRSKTANWRNSVRRSPAQGCGQAISEPRSQVFGTWPYKRPPFIFVASVPSLSVAE